MNPSHSNHSPQHFLVLIVLMFIIVMSTPLRGQGSFILNADDIEARKWMELSSDGRASFVFGFLAGLDHVYNSTGVLVTLNQPLSAQELANKVYKKLLSQPELRTGPIDEIILSSLNDVLFITNKNGKRIDPGLKEVSIGSLNK